MEIEEVKVVNVNEIDFAKIKRTTIKSKNILLRPIKKSDLINNIIWLKDPEVNQFLSSNFVDLDFSQGLKWFKEMRYSISGFIFAIEILNLKKYIGNCGFHKINWDDMSAEFGIVIGDKSYWNQGYGQLALKASLKFAFKKLGLKRIRLFVYEYNKRAIHVYRKCGFRKIDVQKGKHFYNNIYWDVIVMEIKNNM
jgi:RimJ/RimL family protein N-acetyltransferase